MENIEKKKSKKFLKLLSKEEMEKKDEERIMRERRKIIDIPALFIITEENLELTSEEKICEPRRISSRNQRTSRWKIQNWHIKDWKQLFESTCDDPLEHIHENITRYIISERESMSLLKTNLPSQIIYGSRKNTSRF